MTEQRKPGSPGGTRGTHNAPQVSTPKEMGNAGGSAPAGDVKRGSQPPRVAPRKGHSIR
jgi:hypothetical protein